MIPWLALKKDIDHLILSFNKVTTPRMNSSGAMFLYCFNTEKKNSLSTFVASFVPETRKLGIMEVDDSGKILEFVEKPSPDATQSRRAVSV